MNRRMQKKYTDGGGRFFSAVHKEPRVFEYAQNHSRRVRFLKKTLPVAAVIMAAVFSWFTFFAAPAGDPVIMLNDEDGQSGKLVMRSPKVEGSTKDGRAYSFTARKAEQNPDKSGIIALYDILGTVPAGNRGTAKIEAQSAVFDNINNRFQIDAPFTIVTAEGVTAKLLSADVNMQSGQMQTQDEVRIESAAQKLTADSMRICDSGRVIQFSGHVHIELERDEKNRDNADKSGAAAENKPAKPAAGGAAANVSVMKSEAEKTAMSNVEAAR